MSVGINYRRNISVGNSVAFLRFSGSAIAKDYNEKEKIFQGSIDYLFNSVRVPFFSVQPIESN
jgi:hypothetical protein